METIYRLKLIEHEDDPIKYSKYQRKLENLNNGSDKDALEAIRSKYNKLATKVHELENKLELIGGGSRFHRDGRPRNTKSTSPVKKTETVKNPEMGMEVVFCDKCLKPFTRVKSPANPLCNTHMQYSDD